MLWAIPIVVVVVVVVVVGGRRVRKEDWIDDAN